VLVLDVVEVLRADEAVDGKKVEDFLLRKSSRGEKFGSVVAVLR